MGYKQVVMSNAWTEFKIKSKIARQSKSGLYSDVTFAMCLTRAHRGAKNYFKHIRA